MRANEFITEAWSEKYKRSINCSNPKGFSQRAHCQGKKKTSEEQIDEDLRKWFKEKWVRFGPDGKIRGACARGSEGEGKPKCLPQNKAHALGKKAEQVLLVESADKILTLKDKVKQRTCLLRVQETKNEDIRNINRMDRCS